MAQSSNDHIYVNWRKVSAANHESFRKYSEISHSDSPSPLHSRNDVWNWQATRCHRWQKLPVSWRRSASIFKIFPAETMQLFAANAPEYVVYFIRIVILRHKEHPLLLGTVMLWEIRWPPVFSLFLALFPLPEELWSINKSQLSRLTVEQNGVCSKKNLD